MHVSIVRRVPSSYYGAPHCLAPFFDSWQSRKPNRERGKKWTFSYSDKNGEKLKSSRNFSFWLVRDKWNNNDNVRKLTSIISERNPKNTPPFLKNIGTYFRFYKRQWDWQKRHGIFRLACKSHIKKVIHLPCYPALYFETFFLLYSGGGLMVSALDSGSSGPASRPSRGHCVVFMGKTLHSHSASLHPGV